jgi:outer membrane biosynthesis protein TonB
MSELKILNKVRTILGMEVELETAKLEDGETTIEFESLEAGEPVHILTEDDQKIALPVGEYKMQDGRILCVEEEGIIYEIKDEEEEEKEEEPKEEEPKEETEAGYGDKKEEELETEEAKPVKKTIESVVKETFFSDIEALVKENEELKAKIEELEAPKTELSEEAEEESTEEVKEEVKEEVAEEVELSSDEPAETPIVHNPEASNEVKAGFKYGSQNTTLNRIFSRINK